MSEKSQLEQDARIKYLMEEKAKNEKQYEVIVKELRQIMNNIHKTS